MTTNAAWLAAIQALAVTGVNKRFTFPPTSLNTAELPASWPQPFGVDKNSIIISCDDLNKSRTCTYYVAIEPVPQNTQTANYEAMITMVDNMETAFDAMSVMEYVMYTIRSIIVTVAGIDYWALEATLTGSNYSAGGNE